jgi:hypothetical protein
VITLGKSPIGPHQLDAPLAIQHHVAFLDVLETAQPGLGTRCHADAGNRQVRITRIIEPVRQEAPRLDTRLGTVVVPQDQRLWNIGGISLGHANPLSSVTVPGPRQSGGNEVPVKRSEQ